MIEVLGRNGDEMFAIYSEAAITLYMLGKEDSGIVQRSPACLKVLGAYPLVEATTVLSG